VLQELHWQAIGLACPDPIPHQAAVTPITAWNRFPAQEVSLDIVKTVLEICGGHRLSYWDSGIIATAGALGCGQLLSEDMRDGRRIGSLTIVNPFR
jgi:predicted nucleic acid-binding protein